MSLVGFSEGSVGSSLLGGGGGGLARWARRRGGLPSVAKLRPWDRGTVSHCLPVHCRGVNARGRWELAEATGEMP